MVSTLIIIIVWVLAFVPGALADGASLPLGLERDFQAAMRSYQSGDHERARQELLALARQAPANAVVWFNLGNASFLAKDFIGAETAYLKVEALASPLAPAAKLYRARLKRDTGDKKAALDLYQELLRSPGLPPGLRDQALRAALELKPPSRSGERALELYRAGKYPQAYRLLKKTRDPDLLFLKALTLIKLDREDSAYTLLKTLEGNARLAHLRELTEQIVERIRESYAKPKWLFVETAAGTDDNVYKSVTKQSSAVFFADVGGGGRLWAEDLWQWGFGYVGKFRETAGHKDLRTFEHEVQTGLGREIGRELLSFSPFYQHATWAGQASREALGLRARYRTGGSKTDQSVDLEYSQARALNDSLGYLTGPSLSARLGAGWLMFPAYGQAFLSVEKQEIGELAYSTGETLPLSYMGWGPGARVLWRIGPGWTLDFTLFYTQRAFVGSVQPLNLKRTDKELAYGVHALRAFGFGFSAYLSVSYIDNESTIATGDGIDQNFTRMQSLLGVMWDAY